jgi:hypothetical protein
MDMDVVAAAGGTTTAMRYDPTQKLAIVFDEQVYHMF